MTLADSMFIISTDVDQVKSVLDILREHVDSHFLHDTPVDLGAVGAVLLLAINELRRISDRLVEESEND